MSEVIEVWPIISGIIVVGALGVAFRAEITVRVKVLESKVEQIFQLINNKLK